jgi:hypothetical protein
MKSYSKYKLHLPVEPEFIRLPRGAHARCPYTGLSRSTLRELCVPSETNAGRPPVQSRILKKHKYADRGIMLINWASLVRYLNSLPAVKGGES